MQDTKSLTEEPRRRQRRGFRLWEKKRGSRQTGSSRWGAAGEAIFYSVLFMVGMIALTELIYLRVIWKTDSLLTSNWGLVLSVLMLGTLIVTGAIGLFGSVAETGTSAERRAAIRKRAIDSELLADTTSEATLPTVPRDEDFKNSPGIRLAYRLPHRPSPGWRLGAFSVFCLVWNGALAVLGVLAFNQGQESFHVASLFSWEWWTLFRIVVLVYAVIGISSVRHLVGMLVEAATLGPTNVEVSALPLKPGGEYRAFVSQAGHLQLESMELTLVCDEEVSFSDGTDLRIESRRVLSESLFHHEHFEVLPSQPFQCEVPLDVPTEAMHSFVAPNNAITWKLIVSITPAAPAQSKPVSRWLRRWQTRWKKMTRAISGPQNREVRRIYPLIIHP